MKPTIRIKTQKDIRLSKSFFGGLPKLPTNFEWFVWDATPYYLDEIRDAENGYRECGTSFWRAKLKENQKNLLDPLVPLSFLGQIHLEEIPRYGSFPNLPSSGILCFFWASLLSPPGFRASSKGSCRVVYIEDTADLQTPSFPVDVDDKFRDRIYVQPNDFQCSLSFEPGWSSSNYLNTILAADCGDDGEPEIDPFSNIEPFLNEAIEYVPNGFPERDESNVLMKDHSSAGEPMHLLLGGPMEIQTSMEEMCQLCFNGFDEHEYNLNSDPEVAHLKEGTKDWQLLLQLDLDDDLDGMGGGTGMLYFWIRKQDLEKQDFSNVFCEMQCT